jgi:methylmalonyl-CoA/ethylmalonyl-CoA epimerase
MKSALWPSMFSKKVLHMGIVVRNMEQTKKHLKSLGMGPFEPLSLPPFIGELWFKGKPLHSEQNVLFVKGGEVDLELFEPVQGNSPWQEFLDTKGEGIHHIAFAADDIDKEEAEAVKQGVSVLHKARWQGGGGCAYLDFGASNIIVELLRF